jgi:hypothetical protein
MCFRLCRAKFAPASFVAALWVALGAFAAAQESKTQALDATPLASGYLPSSGPPSLSVHPLTPVIDYARKEQDYLKRSVRDFTCRLVKRERIGGYLQDMQFIDMQVREAIVSDNRLVQPLSIYLHFLGPRLVAGRKVVYVEGQNEGKMLVRNGGRHFDYVIAKIDPNGENACEETLVPITQIGFNRLLGQMIDVLERHRRADPTGTNTKAERISGAKINARRCTVIRITHPRRDAGIEFHVANVFVDDELHAPLRVDYSGWPKNPGNPAPLIAEYTYTDLRLNVNLPAAAFTRSRLRSPRD